MMLRSLLLLLLVFVASCEISEASIIAILAAIPVTITAIGTLIVSMRNKDVSQSNNVQVKEIHSLVNANLAAAQADLLLATERVAKLQAMVRDGAGASSLPIEEENAAVAKKASDSRAMMIQQMATAATAAGAAAEKKK